MQPLRLGRLSVTFAFGGSSPERFTTLLPSMTVTRVTGKVRPFMIISAAAGWAWLGWGAAAGALDGAAGAVGT